VIVTYNLQQRIPQRGSGQSHDRKRILGALLQSQLVVSSSWKPETDTGFTNNVTTAYRQVDTGIDMYFYFQI